MCLLAGTVQGAVTMLVPGFVVREVPVRLSNVNNLRFSPGGKLTALGYDGKIHLLHDSDGDGMEDRSTVFWDQPTLSVPVGMEWSKEGLYVSSHGKVSLFRDENGDGRADREEVVASGWPPTDVGSGGVDATAVTVDGSGNVFFGLLTADYSNPYRVKDGVARYSLSGQRGTIQRFVRGKGLETIATGIRVPYALAFNRAGDLFVTDQEGETWCPNGNPLDELNHIIVGRNYGFPPRHETYLPDLVSERPVVGFGPQHQSSCGLVFNESGIGRGRFGPEWWEGDALVAGESRGKIWRVNLAKTPLGYVGKESLIARLSMLTMDMAISAGGALYVACHSGEPDWGTGPNGEGKIFKIEYRDADAPQPVRAWASGLMELRVAFDRPVDGSITNAVRESRVEFGEHVSAADRLETLKPPYEVVKQQEATPRGRLNLIGATLDSAGRTVRYAMDPHGQSVRHAVSVAGVKSPGLEGAGARVDLGYELTGVEASWSGAGKAEWNGWLPHLDWEVSRKFLEPTAEIERLRELIKHSGVLEMRGQFMIPERGVRVRLESPARFQVELGERMIVSRGESGGVHRVELRLERLGAADFVKVKVSTGGEFGLSVSYATAMDRTWRPVPEGWLLLPWAPRTEPARGVTVLAPELQKGGDYERGRELFFGERLKCGTCHRIRGEGNVTGPDLSNLIHRDAASIWRDIEHPSATINPDYVAYTVRVRGGEELTGFVRAQAADAVRVVGADGKEQRVNRGEILDLRPGAISLMPGGLVEGLRKDEAADLLTFLRNAPPVRTRAEIEAVMAGKGEGGKDGRLLNVVLVAGKQDHGPGQHDYPAWQKEWKTVLAGTKGMVVNEAWEWPTEEQWQSAGVVVFYFWNHDWNENRYRQLDAYQERGGGLVVIHSATIADKEAEKLAARIGLAAQPGPTKYVHGPILLKMEGKHPITEKFGQLFLLDEPYWPMIGDAGRVAVVAAAEIEGQERPLMWTFEKGRGRVFASIPGHYSWTWADPLFRILMLRGIAWAGGEAAVRFDR